MRQGLGQVLLHRAVGDIQLPGDLGVGEAFEAVEAEDFTGARRQFRHRLAQPEHVLGLGGFFVEAGALFDYFLQRLVGHRLGLAPRLLPGVIGAAETLVEESFEQGLLEYPHYTRPADWCGRRVPDVLLSGHHENIGRWRRKQ
eukprot:gene15448-18880_t